MLHNKGYISIVSLVPKMMYNSGRESIQMPILASVFRFNEIQIEAVRSIPDKRLLLETDSPYLSVVFNTINTPAFLGDIARKVAFLKGSNTQNSLAISKENGLRLYI